MKKGIVIIALLGAFSAFGQMYTDQYDSTAYHNEIGTEALGDYGASSVRNAVTNRFVLGGFIDSTAKQNSLDRHSGVNRMGINAIGEVYYRNYDKRIFKNKNWGFEIAAGTNYFGGVLYSKDLFGLAMNGNLSYVGDTVNMSGMDVNFTAMQKIGFGLFDINNKSSVRFNLYNISQRINGDFRDLELQQSEDGHEMTLVMDGDIEIGQSTKFNQGFGAGFDLDFRLPISWIKEQEAFIQFKAENVGFGYMYEAQRKYSFDTTITYDGFRFNQLIAENGYFSDSISILDTLGIASTDVNPVFLLPGFIQVSKMVNNNSAQKLQSFFGIRIYPTLIYSPFAFAGVDYRISDHIHAGASVSYGGFAGLRFGAYGQFNWSKFALGVGSNNFSGFARAGGNGTSLYLNAVCRF